MKHIYPFLLLMLFSSLAFGQNRIDGTISFQTDPAKKYSLYIPSGYDANTANPLMLGMHPFNTARWDAKAWTDTLVKFAEANQLILACPDGGIDGNVSNQIDTAFTTFLLDSVRNWYNIDTFRTYIMGFSVGARATYTYGLTHPDVFGGYIPIGAAISNVNEVVPRLQDNSVCEAFYLLHGSLDNPNVRFSPVRNALVNKGAILNSKLMTGVGHTIDFPNRNQILTEAFQWIDSVNLAPKSLESIDLALQSNLKIYPNPVSKTLFVRLSDENLQDTNIQLFDISGKQILSQNIPFIDAHADFSIEIGHLSQGIYFLEISSQNRRAIQKFEILR